MPFRINDPATWVDLSDDELMAATANLRLDIVATVQNEILRRSLGRLTVATTAFQAATSEQAKADDKRARNEFRFAVWTTLISLLFAGAGFYLTWKMNNDALARDAARIRSLYPTPAIVPRGG